MKFSGQTRDGVIDNLLRAYVSRPSNPHQGCPDFDPDRASAYIERALTGAARLQYEKHLSDCPACRKNVVALVRLAQADDVAIQYPAPETARSTWLSRVKRAFGVMSQPKWAMAAAAVIVLAISLPLLLSPSQSPGTLPETTESARRQSAPAAAAPAADGKAEEAAPSLVATNKQHESTDEKPEALTRNAPAARPSDSAAGFSAPAELAKKSDGGSASQLGEEAQRKAEGQLSQAPVQAGAVPGSPAAKSDSDQARQAQPEKDSAQPASEAKVAARIDEVQTKEKTERAEVAPPPPAEPPPSENRRGRAFRPGKLALRDSNPTEAVRPEERKLNGKKFLLRDGAWTDKDFDPNKDLPIVTIIRDSNVYLEVLNKRPGLKPFLTGFPVTERAIIVYKGTVYKLIPQ
jgi:Putative zinc-finger